MCCKQMWAVSLAVSLLLALHGTAAVIIDSDSLEKQQLAINAVPTKTPPQHKTNKKKTISSIAEPAASTIKAVPTKTAAESRKENVSGIAEPAASTVKPVPKMAAAAPKKESVSGTAEPAAAKAGAEVQKRIHEELCGTWCQRMAYDLLMKYSIAFNSTRDPTSCVAKCKELTPSVFTPDKKTETKPELIEAAAARLKKPSEAHHSAQEVAGRVKKPSEAHSAQEIAGRVKKPSSSSSISAMIDEENEV